MHPLQQQNHLFWRAAFGPTPDMLIQSTPFKPNTYVAALIKASEVPHKPLVVAKNMLDGLGNGLNQFANMQKMQGADSINAVQQRRMMQRQSREDVRSLNLLWLSEMVHSAAQLREKMSLFWHGHFACRNLNSYFQQQLLEVIRTHALGNFGTLLAEVSTAPAMLQFLNNQQNRKNSPNENFAREVMELFTLGRGHYSENDVKDAARAFTGWGFDAQGQFQFRQFQHDTGSKTIFGKTGNFKGEEVLEMLLANPQTARFICTKMYKFFVNENVNTAHVEWLAKRFYDNKYEIKPLLTDLFTAEWFYAPENIGTHIKSPVELIAGIMRQLSVTVENEQALLLIQRGLGQILFYPPNVAGWPGGKSWIDSSSLLFRMRLPQLFALNEGMDINLKNDDDTDMGQAKNSMRAMNRFNVKATIDWKKVTAPFDKLNEDKLHKTMAASFLQTGKLPDASFMQQFITRDNYKANLTIALMSLPEYQLS